LTFLAVGVLVAVAEAAAAVDASRLDVAAQVAFEKAHFETGFSLDRFQGL
jgi:hypothetical protein